MTTTGKAGDRLDGGRALVIGRKPDDLVPRRLKVERTLPALRPLDAAGSALAPAALGTELAPVGGVAPAVRGPLVEGVAPVSNGPDVVRKVPSPGDRIGLPQIEQSGWPQRAAALRRRKGRP